MTKKLKELKAKAEQVDMYDANFENLWKAYNDELEKSMLSFLEAFDKEDVISVFTEWLKRNASAKDGRDLYWLTRETKIYIPAIFPTSEFDCEEEDIDDEEWQEVIDEANERLMEDDAIIPFKELVWDTITEVLEEKAPEWYLG